MPALDDSVITQAEVEREDTAAVGAGLDVLEEPDRVKDPWWRRIGSSIIPPILAMLVVLVIWEIVYLLKLKPEVMLPSPAAVWTELVTLVQIVAPAFPLSTSETSSVHTAEGAGSITSGLSPSR